MSNQARGLKSKRNGQRFERLVERSCIDYKKRKQAFIQKTPEAMRPLRPMKNGKFISVFEKKSQPDFQGTLWKGRSVVFEAKHTEMEDTVRTAVPREELIAATRDIPEDTSSFTCIGACDFAQARDFTACGVLFMDNNGEYIWKHHSFGAVDEWLY